MFTVTSGQLEAWMAAFLWPFVRILALIATEPILGNRSVPTQVKIGVAFMITIIVAPSLGPMPNVAPGSAEGLLILLQQIVIGVAMGLMMRVVFNAVEMAGHLIGLQMGLGFATFFDPQNSGQTAVMASFLGLFAILVFLALDGHLLVILTLIETFKVLPVGAGMEPGFFQAIVHWGATIFSAGLWLSLPVVAALLITNLAIGIMTRAAPQLNIFAVGFPLTLAAGFLVLFVTLPYFVPVLEKLWTQAIGIVIQVMELANR